LVLELGKKAPANQTILPSPGLELGQRAPAFALTDQFGHEQSNETLKGLQFSFSSVPPIGDPSAKRSSCSSKMQNNDLQRKA
jgi:hypothetical protein